MPATIQILLQEDVDKVGRSGELVRVRPGFARNYLIPRQLAVPATTAQVNRLNHEKAIALAKSEKTRKEATELAGKLGELKVTLPHSAGEDGKLFGSVTSKEVHAAVKALGFDIDRKKFQLAEPLRAVGDYEVPVRLLSQVIATVKVSVVRK